VLPDAAVQAVIRSINPIAARDINLSMSTKMIIRWCGGRDGLED
jgi:hypothetical protein